MGLKDLFNCRILVDELGDKFRVHNEAREINGQLYQSIRVLGPADSPYNEFLVFWPLDDEGRRVKNSDHFLISFGYNEVGDELSRGFVNLDYRRVLLRRRLDFKDFPVFAVADEGRCGKAHFLGPLTRAKLQEVIDSFMNPDPQDLMPEVIIRKKLAALDKKEGLHIDLSRPDKPDIKH